MYVIAVQYKGQTISLLLDQLTKRFCCVWQITILVKAQNNEQVNYIVGL